MSLKKDSKNNRVLPNFFCIGVMRGGSSWLYEILKGHPEIYLCSYHKETHFFSHNYDRGLNWYKSFFPKEEEAKRYKTIGEIAPTYYFQKHAPELILKHIPNARFIIILRNPINRAFSEYKYYKLSSNYNDSFEDYLKKYPYIIRIGYYSQHLKNWLKYFPKSDFLVLIFEEVMNEPLKALRKISNFLDIDHRKLYKKNLSKSVNPSSPPRFSKLYLIGFRLHNTLLSKDLYKITNKLSKLKPLFYRLGEKKRNDKISPAFRSELFSKYKNDIEELEKILNRDLSIWKY